MIFMYASGTRSVSMPSRAYTSFLPNKPVKITDAKSGVNALSGLYLISTRNCLMEGSAEIIVSMPSLAYTSFLQSRCDQKYVLPGHRVSMPSRAYTSFLQYPFKNLGFMRFPEPVFTGIYQNILTAAVFRAC